MASKRDDMRKRFRRVHLDFHTPEFPAGALEKFDAQGLAEVLAKARVQVANFFAKCHYGNSYYFTQVGHRHCALKRDMLAEFLQAAHEREIAVSVYYSLLVDDRACRQNPDWEMRAADGSVMGGVFRRPCISSPYIEELVLPQIRELLTGYALDGLWFDFTLAPYCACQYCQRAFRLEGGKALPKGPDDANWAEYAAWRRNESVLLMRRIRRMVDQLKPGTQLCGNWAYCTVQPEPVPVDSVTYLTCDPPTTELGQVDFSFEGRYLGTTGMPYELITTRFHEGWGDWTAKPAEMLKAEMATILAAGATCCIGDQIYPDGTVEPAVYQAIAEVFSFVEEREEACANSESVPFIAVLNGAATYRLECGLGGGYGGLENVRGCHLALVQSGMHFDIVNEAALLPRLADYRAVVLPDQVALREDVAQAIAKFVSGGGVLLATHRCGLLDENGRQAKQPALAQVMGIEHRGVSCYSNCYIQCDDRNLLAGLPAMPILVKGASALVAPVTARPLARLVHPMTENAPDRFVSHRQAPPGHESGLPAITYEEFGKGKAIYVAPDIFGAFWRTNDPRLRRLVANLLEVAIDKKLLAATGPASVEVSLRRKGSDWFVHLVNHHEEKRVAGAPTLERMPIVTDVTIEANLRKGQRVGSVTLLPENTPLEFSQKAGELSFVVPRVQIHAIVRISFA
jgi:hypothetical protein